MLRVSPCFKMWSGVEPNRTSSTTFGSVRILSALHSRLGEFCFTKPLIHIISWLSCIIESALGLIPSFYHIHSFLQLTRVNVVLLLILSICGLPSELSIKIDSLVLYFLKKRNSCYSVSVTDGLIFLFSWWRHSYRLRIS